MDEITLVSNGTLIQECTYKIEEYCSKVPAYEIYDKIDSPQDDSITLFDICLANNIGARMNSQAIREFWRHALKYNTEIECALSRIPADIDLHAVDENAFFADLHALFGLFFDKKHIPGVRYAGVTKTLHKKRPRVLPVVDQAVVINRYLGPRNWLGTSTDAGCLVEATKLIRKDIVGNLEQLQEIQNNLLGTYNIGLTLLRIFDILLYQHYTG